VLLDERVSDLTVGLQDVQRRFFILAHEAAETLHIGAEDRGELALDAR